MKKTIRLAALALACVCCLAVIRTLYHKHILSHELIRLHVVADSDSDHDQSVKLRVRDAVLREAESIAGLEDAADAKTWLLDNLELLEKAANEALRAAGSEDEAVVTMCREAFPIRQYDTFTLPSGVYESLRVTIGSGEGKNWWCVVFPKLCIGAASKDFRDTAVGAGFSGSLADTLSGEADYEISFFLLDCLGKLENFFHFRR